MIVRGKVDHCCVYVKTTAVVTQALCDLKLAQNDKGVYWLWSAWELPCLASFTF